MRLRERAFDEESVIAGSAAIDTDLALEALIAGIGPTRDDARGKGEQIENGAAF